MKEIFIIIISLFCSALSRALNCFMNFIRLDVYLIMIYLSKLIFYIFISVFDSLIYILMLQELFIDQDCFSQLH